MIKVYECRLKKPRATVFSSISASSPEEAANLFHNEFAYEPMSIKFVDEDSEGKRHVIFFALIEVKGHGEWVSRIYSYGLWRKGGVRSWAKSSASFRLKEIADRLDWAHDPQDLIATGWAGEESMEDAIKRSAKSVKEGTR